MCGLPVSFKIAKNQDFFKMHKTVVKQPPFVERYRLDYLGHE